MWQWWESSCWSSPVVENQAAQRHFLDIRECLPKILVQETGKGAWPKYTCSVSHWNPHLKLMQVFRGTALGGDGSRSVTMQAHRANQGCVCRHQDCGAVTAWLCNHNCSLQPKMHGVWGVLCLSLHYSISIPGNMAKKMGLLLWIENWSYNSI